MTLRVHDHFEYTRNEIEKTEELCVAKMRGKNSPGNNNPDRGTDGVGG